MDALQIAPSLTDGAVVFLGSASAPQTGAALQRMPNPTSTPLRAARAGTAGRLAAAGSPAQPLSCAEILLFPRAAEHALRPPLPFPW